VVAPSGVRQRAAQPARRPGRLQPTGEVTDTWPVAAFASAG